MIQVGDVLTLELKSQDEEEEKFKCRLVDIKDDEFYYRLSNKLKKQ